MLGLTDLTICIQHCTIFKSIPTPSQIRWLQRWHLVHLSLWVQNIWSIKITALGQLKNFQITPWQSYIHLGCMSCFRCCLEPVSGAGLFNSQYYSGSTFTFTLCNLDLFSPGVPFTSRGCCFLSVSRIWKAKHTAQTWEFACQLTA